MWCKLKNKGHLMPLNNNKNRLLYLQLINHFITNCCKCQYHLTYINVYLEIWSKHTFKNSKGVYWPPWPPFVDADDYERCFLMGKGHFQSFNFVPCPINYSLKHFFKLETITKKNLKEKQYLHVPPLFLKLQVNSNGD